MYEAEPYQAASVTTALDVKSKLHKSQMAIMKNDSRIAIP